MAVLTTLGHLETMKSPMKWESRNRKSNQKKLPEALSIANATGPTWYPKQDPVVDPSIIFSKVFAVKPQGKAPPSSNSPGN